MKKILTGVLTITGMITLVISASGAFFNDTETTSNNILQAGAFDLLVNGQNDPEGIVEFTDLKPGDDIIIEKDLYIDNTAYIFLHLKDFVSSNGLQTEPEEEEELIIGEKFDIENYLLYDLSKLGDPDEVLVSLEDENTMWEMQSCWIPLGTIPGGQTTTITQSFHFPEDITNWAQGDSLTFTEEFYAEQFRNNQSPTPPDTESGRVWDPIQKHCVDCEEGQTYVSQVISSSQGLRKNTTPVLPERSFSSNALGAPDTTNVNDPKWYSLGYGGSITLAFSFPVNDGVGDDLSFHEVTGGRTTYPLESAQVEVSQDGITWEVLGEVTSEPTGDGVMFLDIGVTSFDWIRYVRVTDSTNSTLHDALSDGYDLDAVDAVYGTCSYQI